MPLIAGMFSSIGPEPESKPQAPSSSARRYACAASVTRKAIAQIDGPCKRAKRCANESGSELMMKLMSPCRYSVTRLWRWRAIGTNPSFSNSAPSAAGSGAAYSMNSKPSVPIGLDVSWLPIAVAPLPWFYSSQCAAIGRADDCNRGPLSDDLGNNMPINNETVALNVDNRPGQDGSSHSRGAAERRAIDQPGGGRPSVTVAIAVPATNSPPGEAGRDPPVRGAGGLGLLAYVSVQLEKRGAMPLDDFKARVQAWPEVVACFAMTGEMDYLLRVHVEDLQHFSRFVMEQLLMQPGVIDTTALPLRQLGL